LQVYKATQTVNLDNAETAAVHVRAVKILASTSSLKDRTAFIDEAEVMDKLDHRNLVRLIGVAMQQRPWLSVIEFCPFGDLG
jgi:serine/threonine protein kinase